MLRQMAVFLTVLAIGEGLAWAALTGAIWLINTDLPDHNYGLQVARFMAAVVCGCIGVVLFIFSFGAALEAAGEAGQ